MKLAVCFYGQPRTYRYCWPWIQAMYKGLDIKVFAYLRNYNTNYTVKTTTREKQFLTQDEIDAVIQCINPYRYVWVDDSLEVQLNRRNSNFPYGSDLTAEAMHGAVNLVTTDDIDVIVLQRLDCLIGWDPRDFVDFIKFGISKNSLYVLNDRIPIPEGMGLQDQFIFGTADTMRKLIEKFPKVLETPRPTFSIGIHSMLKQFADEAFIKIKVFPSNSSIVRSESDLSIPVFDSVKYHFNFTTNSFLK